MTILDNKRTPHDDELVAKLNRIALKLRRNILIMTTKAGSGHPGGSLSSADIVTALYFHQLRHDPQNPKWEDRDRFVLSKGHSCPVLYAALAQSDYFPEDTLWTLRKMGSILQGHPDMNKTPGLEASSGNLGQGLSIALGMALAVRIDRKKYHVFALLGDGETDEGQIWEAAMAAAHYKVDNLSAILDLNGIQLDGLTKDIMSLEPVADKWRAFGWHVIEIDGHNMREILDALDTAEHVKYMPTMVVAHTIKGKGVSFMEGQVKFHGTALTEEQLAAALQELQLEGSED